MSDFSIRKSLQEGRILENVDIQQAYRKAERVIEQHSIVVTPELFSGLYSRQEIESDMKDVKKEKVAIRRRDARHSRLERGGKQAVILEALLCDQVNSEEWFGSEVSMILPHLHDDYENGIDGVLEITNKGKQPSQIALAIDAAFGSDVIQDKLAGIQTDIEHGHLTHMKYFYSKRSGLLGKLENVPRVVAGVEYPTLERVMALWLEGSNKALAKDPLKALLAQEFYDELQAFALFARRIKKKEIAEILEARAQLVLREMHPVEENGLRGEKSRVPVALMRDKVYQKMHLFFHTQLL